MEKQEILRLINGVFQEVFEDKSLVITEMSEANDIDEWDSLTHIQLITAVEKAFSVRFKLDDILSFNNVGDMVVLLEDILNSKRS